MDKKYSHLSHLPKYLRISGTSASNKRIFPLHGEMANAKSSGNHQHRTWKTNFHLEKKSNMKIWIINRVIYKKNIIVYFWMQWQIKKMSARFLSAVITLMIGSLHLFCNVCLFVSLFVVYRSTREFFTQLETSSLPVRGFQFWPMLSILGLWAVRVL